MVKLLIRTVSSELLSQNVHTEKKTNFFWAVFFTDRRQFCTLNQDYNLQLCCACVVMFLSVVADLHSTTRE